MGMRYGIITNSAVDLLAYNAISNLTLRSQAKKADEQYSKMVSSMAKRNIGIYRSNLESLMYTYDDSVVDGVNVPPRVYRIITDVTAHGGIIEKGTKIIETSKRSGKSVTVELYEKHVKRQNVRELKKRDAEKKIDKEKNKKFVL